ncbi:MAG: response regulator [Bacteroidota bacterium]
MLDTPVRLLLIEDDPDDYIITRRLLQKGRQAFELDWHKTYEAGLDAVLSHPYDVALVDYRLGPRTGLQLIEDARARGAATPLILLTGQGDLDTDLQAMMAGAADYLSKNHIDAQLLERSIRYALERHRADERIREQAELIDKARDVIMALDLKGQVTYWNKSAEDVLGWHADEVTTDHLAEGDLRDSDAWKQVLMRGAWSGEWLPTTKSGADIVLDSRWTLVRDSFGEPRSVLMIKTDITERKKLELQFLRSQRMESIGTLVGGIAHDLGNLLVPVLLGVEVLQTRLATDEKSSRTLSMIQKSAQRGSDMVRQVLAFARGVEGERHRLHPGRILDEVMHIVDQTFPRTVAVTTDVSPDLHAVIGDATQLQQVLVNLCVNARDAMPSGGELHIEGSNVELTEENELLELLNAESGTYVCIAITDTGTGMPPDVLAKVFEPFFTTKPTGKGTGLGLSTVYSIVRSHGGFVNATSEVGEGTTFSVYLPMASETHRPEPLAADRQDLRGHGEHILLVDDEDALLDVTQDLLEDAGYMVTAAQGGDEAIAFLNRYGSDFDILLTDLMMPGIDGLAVIKHAQALHAELPILANSGLATDRAAEVLAAGAAVCLPKPCPPERLFATLRDLLDAKPSPSA